MSDRKPRAIKDLAALEKECEALESLMSIIKPPQKFLSKSRKKC
jgi:hypothetical protein